MTSWFILAATRCSPLGTLDVPIGLGLEQKADGVTGTFSLVTPTFALISNKSVTFQFLTISLQLSQTKWAVEFGKRAEARVDLRERSFGRLRIKPWLAKPQIWRRKVSVNFDRNSGRKFMKPGA